jgi:hypothetical protein
MATKADRSKVDDGVLTLVNRVADVRGEEVTDLPPIQETIDGDVLNGLLASHFPGRCTFKYAGCEVTISGDGSIRVRELATNVR